MKKLYTLKKKSLIDLYYNDLYGYDIYLKKIKSYISSNKQNHNLY